MANIKAFPSEGEFGQGGRIYHYGMDLRDYFAAKAMQSFIKTFAKGCDRLPAKDIHTKVAKISYELADVMLEARSK